MLNIKEKQCTNSVDICGILSELNVEPKTATDGREFVTCEAKIKVDQDVNGKMTENEIPVQFYSMKYKKGTVEAGNPVVSKVYTSICEFPTKFKSLASLPDEKKDEASKVVIQGGSLGETVFLDEATKQEKTGFRVSSNFLNATRSSNFDADGKFVQSARFELSGVVLKTAREVDGNGEETGRLKVTLGVVGYQGRVDKFTLIAETPSCVDHIETNWQEGDTVNVYGAINFKSSVKTWKEELGFGEPIVRTKTETRKELIILGGSPSGLEEAYSYDSDDIKAGLLERKERIAKSAQKKNAGAATTPTNKGGAFDF